MSNRFGRALLNLGANFIFRRRIVDQNSNLILVGKKAARGAFAIRVESDGLHGEITDVSADHDADKPEETSRNGRDRKLGSILHVAQAKHMPFLRKA